MAELRGCPLCGSTDVSTKTSAAVVPGGLTMILCWWCGATISFDGKERKEQAITAWNTRAYDAEMERLQQLVREKTAIAIRQQERADAFEDALERGEMVRVPVPIGTKVFMRYMDCNHGEWTEDSCHDAPGKGCDGCPHRHPVAHERRFCLDMIPQWGISYFLARAEAESALEKEGTCEK